MSSTFILGERSVNRIGYGAMQLCGSRAFGPPESRENALAVLRRAVECGVNHIDTSDFYGPYITNQIIRDALKPYPGELAIVTKVGALRGPDGSWREATSRDELIQAVHSNLRNLGLDVLDVVNLRAMFGMFSPAEGSLEAPLSVLAELQRSGLIRHIGLSNVTPTQIAEAQRICPVACVQNRYSLVHREDDALIEELAGGQIPYVPFFPLSGFTAPQMARLSEIAQLISSTPMQVALAWLLRRSPNILLIPGTASLAHLEENLAASQVELPDFAGAALERLGSPAPGVPAHGEDDR